MFNSKNIKSLRMPKRRNKKGKNYPFSCNIPINRSLLQSNQDMK